MSTSGDGSTSTGIKPLKIDSEFLSEKGVKFINNLHISGANVYNFFGFNPLTPESNQMQGSNEQRPKTNLEKPDDNMAASYS